MEDTSGATIAIDRASAAVGAADQVGLGVHEVAIEHRGRFAHACCRLCGWRGPARRAVAVADRDGELHRLT